MSSVDHALLTRFNLPSPGVESLIRAREGWLRGRVSLFERYSLPSVAAQTCTEFRWLVYFDPESPDWLMQRIDAWAQESPFVPVFRATVSTEDLLCDIEAHVGRQHPELITSNLDNDDALARNFIERVQAAKVSSDRAAIYLVDGLIKRDSLLYSRTDRSNAFCSARETWGAARTCWSEWHTLLGTQMPVVEVRDGPGWLQVVHGSNVSNRVRGRLVSPVEHRPAFPGLLEDVPCPGRTVMVRERAVAEPLRGAREMGRAAVKWAAMGILGRERLADVKLAVASVLRRRPGRRTSDASTGSP